MSMNVKLSIGSVLLAATAVPLAGQPAPQISKRSPSVAELQREVAKLTSELKACRGDKTAGAPDPKRQEAIASLQAVQSVVAGGANITEFKKYQLESKIKVDALPNTAENGSIKRVSEIFADATKLLIAWQVRRMVADEVEYFKKKYRDDKGFMQMFEKVPEGGFGERDGLGSVKLEEELGSLTSQYAGKYLLIRAQMALMLVLAAETRSGVK